MNYNYLAGAGNKNNCWAWCVDFGTVPRAECSEQGHNSDCLCVVAVGAMADWHVSDSDSDEEDKSIPEFSIVRIDRAKVLELLEAVEKRKTLELECLCRVARKEHPKANGRSCRKRVASPVDRRSGEEVSETASVRSTHTAASTSMECRDMRK